MTSYLAGLAPGSSRATMAAALRTLARLATGDRIDAPELIPWHEFRAPYTTALRSELADRYRPADANLRLSALRGVLREAWRLGLMPGDDYHRAVDLKPIRGDALPRGRALDAREIQLLFDTAFTSPRPTTAARDAALLALAYGCGLRRSELSSLDLEDFDPRRSVLKVRGKGNREREAPLNAGVAHAVEAWIRARGPESGPLIHPIDRAGRIQRRRLKAPSVRLILQRLGDRAGIEHFAPHDLRRTFVGDLLDAGADLSLVQQLAGHASPATTARYDRRPERARRNAAELLVIPIIDR